MTMQQDMFIPGPAGRLSVRTKGLDRQRPVVVLVQGSNLTGQSIFDFQYSDADGGYSLMDALVRDGFAAVTFSIRGYGASDAPADPFDVTTEAAMEDLEVVIAWLAREGHERPHLLAFSWGGRIAGRWAEDNSERIGRLVLYNPARGGGGLVLPAPTEPWFVNDPQFYAQKLEPEFTDAGFREALCEHVVAHDARSPNGIRRENATPVTAIVPERVTNPTLMIYGVEAAKAGYMRGGIERGAFFERLGTADKSFVIIPEAGDFAHFQKARRRLAFEITWFLRLK